MHRIEPADQAGVRRANLALLIQTLREHGAQSRAQLAVRSALSKATVSSLVTDLERRGLVDTDSPVSGGRGRPGRPVQLRAAGACGVGLEVNVGHVGVLVAGLDGESVLCRRVACDVPSAGPERTLDLLAELTEEALAASSAVLGPAAGVTVSVPGLVHTGSGSVTLAPRLRWRDIAVADGLAARTGVPLEHIGVDNDANLATLAELAELTQRAGWPVSDLVYLTGDFGIGAGVVSGGRLLRGAEGFAGEVGHLAMDPRGHYCSCGRRGCWETQVGLAALLRLCADPHDPVHDPTLDAEERVRIVRANAERGDPRTLAAVQQIGEALGAGVSVLVNLLNPAVVVLGGYFAALPQWLVEPLRQEVVSSVLAPGAGGVQVVGSRLGFTASVAGAAQAALRRVLDDPTVVPPLQGAPV